VKVSFFILIIAVLATVGCDRVTKQMAASSLATTHGRSYLSGIVRLEYAENTGGFLGLGANLPAQQRFLVFTVATGLVLIGAIALAIRHRLTGWPLVGAGVFIAAGASNLVDRALHGTVVDFMIVGVGPLHTGIFNVADAVMMAGALVVVVAEARKIKSVDGDS
jgi:signal peptidase II